VSEVTIVGAGPAGLVAAIAAKRLGLEPTVFEGAADFKRVGGGILLQNNGLQVLGALGLLESFRPFMRVTPVLVTELPDGRRLAAVDYRKLAVPHPYTAVVLRYELQEHLLAAAQREGVTLHFGSRCNGVVRTEGAAVLSFENGVTHTARVLLACDGIHSHVREGAGVPYVKREIRRAYLRAVAELHMQDDLIREIWGADGRRIGICPLPGNRTYIFTTAPFGQWQGVLEHDLEGWIRSWAPFGPLVQHLLRAVPDWRRVNYSEVAEVVMPNWFHPPIFFVGDAAHAMTPNLGQGANAAMVDALVLVRLLALEPRGDLTGVGQQYEAIRKDFVRRTQRTAYRAGVLAELTSKPLQRLRNRTFSLVQRVPSLGRSALLLAAGYNPSDEPYLQPKLLEVTKGQAEV